MRLLILRGGALGDFIVTLPALRLIRENATKAEVELVGNATAAELGIGRFYLDRCYSQHEARWAALCSEEPLPESLVEFLGRFDVIVNFWPDPDEVLTKHLHRWADASPRRQLRMPAARPAGPPRSFSHPLTQPAAKHFCAAFEPLGWTTDNFESQLFLTDQDTSAASAILSAIPSDHFIAIHPGSGSKSKNWPLGRWQELALKMAAETSAHFLIVAGEADSQEAAELSSKFPQSRRTILAQLYLPTLAAVLSRCSLFLGHDSGISHLAASVRAKCILLFGPTDPSIWAPPGKNVVVLQRGSSVAAITEQDVWAAIESSAP